jgi:hypothetical protein
MTADFGFILMAVAYCAWVIFLVYGTIHLWITRPGKEPEPWEKLARDRGDEIVALKSRMAKQESELRSRIRDLEAQIRDIAWGDSTIRSRCGGVDACVESITRYTREIRAVIDKRKAEEES